MPSVPWPTVSVIVPVHGDRGELEHTARALAEQDYDGPVQVIVVDNGNNHRLAASLSALPEAVLAAQSVAGSYRARNTGLEVATGDILAFTDGDCIPRPDWLRQAVGALVERNEPCFVGGAIHVFARDESSPTWAEIWDTAEGLRQDDYVQQQGWAATANLVTTRPTMQRVGPFDERLKSGGDREWGHRAGAAGVTAIYAAAAVVDHPARRRMAELHTKVRRVTRGEVDRRRMAGEPFRDASGTWASLRPNTRSIVRKSANVSSRWTTRRTRYVLVSHWLQYYFIYSHLRARVESRGA